MLTQDNIKAIDLALLRYSHGERGVLHKSTHMEATAVSVLRALGVQLERKKATPEAKAARRERMKAYHREFAEFRKMKAAINSDFRAAAE